MLIRSRSLKRFLHLVALVLLGLNLILFFLPYNSPIVLAIHFNLSRLGNLLRSGGSGKDAWLYRPAKYPVDLTTEVGILIKTGYGTRHRVAAQLEALGLGSDDKDKFVVVGDWTFANQTLDGVVVHDAVGGVMRLKEMERLQNSLKFIKYMALAAAIEEGYEEKANHIAKNYGWDLDALKFLWGLELTYTSLPKKKWYLILDDDTYIIQPSLSLLLTHWDPSVPYYIGNAVGDYKGRFAHGGSAIILSHEAVKRLFDNPKIVAEGNLIGLDETWGDKLVATTFQKLGIYLDERYSHFFNGEPPAMTQLTAERFCSPLVSFHSIKKPAEMRQIGIAFRDASKPVYWSQLWGIYGAPSLSAFRENPIRANHDFVGRTDERSRSFGDVENAETCLKECKRQGKACLAWTWVKKTKDCLTSPWMIVGEKPAGSYSGVSVTSLEKLIKSC